MSSLFFGIARRAQTAGVGQALRDELIASGEARGIWTLQDVTIAENAASLALPAKCRFRVVGRRQRISKLAGVWRDTVLTERPSDKIGLD